MDQIKQQQQSDLTSNDEQFVSLIKAFSEESNISHSIYLERFIHLFNKVSKKEKALFSHKNSVIQLNNLKLTHIVKIQKHIQLLVTKNELEYFEATTMLNYLSRFCTFLRKKEIANLYYTPPKRRKTSSPNTQQDDAILLKFVQYLELKRYAATTIHQYRTSIKYFLAHSNYQPGEQQTTEFWQRSIHQFEKYLMKDVTLENIALCTAYGYLKAVRLFLRFLAKENQINFRYVIPDKMIQNGKRANEYVSIQDVLLVVERMFEHSKDILRDISILLIILETGCRPIEIENLNVDDIYIHEKLIVLKSKKSNQRTLCLTNTTFSFLKQYLQIRENYLAETNWNALFLSSTGSPLRSNYISQLFRNYNLKTFNEIRFTPKTLRHTFITNALNNQIGIEQVRESVGHKYLISTHYYFYRDVNHMKKLFMDKQLF